MSKFTRYRVFAAVVENGSLAAAAEALIMSPSSVSKHLSNLESELDVGLIDRTTHQLVVTESGISFYTRVKKILTDVEEAEEWVQDKKSTLEGSLTISLPSIMLKTPLLSLLAEFSEEHPAIRFDIRVSNRFDDLVGRKTDFAFRIGRLKDSQYIATPIAQLNVVFCASPDFIKKHGNMQLKKILQERHLIIPSFLNASSFYQLSNIDPSFNRENKQHYHSTEDALAVDAMAKAGLGVCPTFDVAVENDIKNGQLVCLPVSKKIPPIEFNLVFHKRAHMPSRMKEFKSFIKSRLPAMLSTDKP